jgi:hypothetical protein
LADLKKWVRFDTTVLPVDNQARTDPYAVMHVRGQHSLIKYIQQQLTKEPQEEQEEADNG